MVSSVTGDGVGTLLVSSPFKNVSQTITAAGAVYVFNGTGRYWSQMQKLVPVDVKKGDEFGSMMRLDGNRAIISTIKTDYLNEYWGETQPYPNHGAAYIFERNSTTLMWSQQSKLFPRDGVPGIQFGMSLAITGDYALVTSKADDKTRVEILESKETDFSKLAAGSDADYGYYGGSVYVFKTINGQWSQQQKLTASDLYFWQPTRGTQIYGYDFPGIKKFANDLTVYKNSAIISTFQNFTNKASKLQFPNPVTSPPFNLQNGGNPPLGPYEPNQVAYVYTLIENVVNSKTIGRWSLQQRLFVNNETDYGVEKIYYSKVDTNRGDLLTSHYGPAASVSYTFKHYDLADGTVRWSMQARLEVDENTNPVDKLVFQKQGVWGGYMLHKSQSTNPTASPTKKVAVTMRTQLHSRSCLILWLSDHILDGWDNAVLTVRAPDFTNDTFYPDCNQIDPFKVRYCPYDPADEGAYIIKIFAAQEARFFWEASWQVMIESTGEWYKGDYSTEMKFFFSSTTREFSFIESSNEINMNAPCYRCATFTQRNWAQSQIVGGDAFWPLVAYGAPYYISNVEGLKLFSYGRVCNDGDEGFGNWKISKYECYQTLLDGVYILRLGGGLFGRETGFPYPDAWWKGCGLNGTWDEQLIFQISENKCTAIQKFKYNPRCRSSATATYGPQHYSNADHNIALYEINANADHSNQEHHNSEDSYNLIQEIMKRHNEEKNKKIDNLDEHLMI